MLEQHIATGRPIVYTSADSVLQICAHEEHFGLERLYALCAIARELVDPLRIGLSWDNYFVGSISELRVFQKARSADEIRADMYKRLSGQEPSLIGLYRRASSGAVQDYSNTRATIGGSTVTAATEPVFPFQMVAAVENGYYLSSSSFYSGDWHHLAATYKQSYALALSGADSAYINVGNDAALELTRDMTLEVFFMTPALGVRQGILAKGMLTGGALGGVPYAIYLEWNGQITFTYEAQGGSVFSMTSATVVTANQMCRFAVTRKASRTTTTTTVAQTINLAQRQGNGLISTTPQTFMVPTVTFQDGWDVVLYFNGVADTNRTWTNIAEAGKSGANLELGRVVSTSTGACMFKGTLTEVRLWNSARADVGKPITGTEDGLVAYFRMEENQGSKTRDDRGGRDATFGGGVTWVKSPDPAESRLVLYHNGDVVPSTWSMLATQLDSTGVTGYGTNPAFALGAGCGGGAYLNGALEEVRIWKRTRTQSQIRDNLFGRLKGEQQDLIACYSLDNNGTDANGNSQLADSSFAGTHLNIVPGQTTSPRFMNTGGSRFHPTPPGVPVAMTSPGTSSVKAEMYSMSAGTSKISRSVGRAVDRYRIALWCVVTTKRAPRGARSVPRERNAGVPT